MRRLRTRLGPYLIVAAVAIALAPAVTLLILRFVNPPTTSFITYTREQLRAKHDHAAIIQHWIPIDRMAACMPLAAVASEDQTFPTNHGFAFASIVRAMKQNERGGPIRGASTITQQTAKNLFLWPAKSYVRKAIGAYTTVWMALLWPKRRVLSVYLNVAQFSPRVFGVSAAAHQLFGRSASALTDSQCAALAAVLPDPQHENAAHPGPYALRREHWILKQMRQLGPHYLDTVLQ